MAILVGTVGINVAANVAASQNANIPSGPQGEEIVAELHGKFYTAARAGNVFLLATAVAGTVIPVQATNLVSTFTLYNPLTSGKNVELISYSLGVLNATTVVGDVSLYFQTGVGNTVTVPGTLTVLPIRNVLLGGGLSTICSGYSAATLVNTVGTNAFRGPTLATFGAVTTTADNPIRYDFDTAPIIMPPGSLITVAGSAAQTQAMTQNLTFAEWPV